jgi:hypothetical protein
MKQPPIMRNLTRDNNNKTAGSGTTLARNVVSTIGTICQLVDVIGRRAPLANIIQTSGFLFELSGCLSPFNTSKHTPHLAFEFFNKASQSIFTKENCQ